MSRHPIDPFPLLMSLVRLLKKLAEFRSSAGYPPRFANHTQLPIVVLTELDQIAEVIELVEMIHVEEGPMVSGSDSSKEVVLAKG